MGNNCIWILKIIGIIENKWNYGRNYVGLILGLLRIYWDVFGNLVVENNYIWLLKLLGLLRVNEILV